MTAMREWGHTRQLAPSPIKCRIAQTPEMRDRVYQLRYRCYSRSGAIDTRADRRFSDTFDETPNHFSFLVQGGSEAIATLRISVVKAALGWTDSPACRVFGDHPALIEATRESFVEASRLCFGPQARRDVFIGLLGNMAALAEFYQAQWLIACPRVEHAPLYQRLFGFRPLAEPRPYHAVKFETVMLGVRIDELSTYVESAPVMRKAWSAALTAWAESSPARTA